jgi:hypothetical protein
MVFLLFLSAPSTFTQPQEPKLQVATRLIKPFVFEESPTRVVFGTLEAGE